MSTFTKKVSYHETDKMGIVHHSNYVRWMEDARVAYLEGIGAPFTDIEALGIVSPVVAIDVRYKTPMAFGDIVSIDASISKYNGVRLEVSYEIRNAETGEIAATATSCHCFSKDGKVCNMKKAAPEIHAALEESL